NDLQTMKTYMKKLGKMYTSSGPRIEINTYKKGSILESEENISDFSLLNQLDPEKKVDSDATSAIVTMLKKLEETDPLSFNTVLRDKDDVRIHQKIHEKDNPLMGLLLKDTETYKKIKNVKKEYTDEELAELETKYQYFQGRLWRGYIDEGKVVKIEEVEIPKPNKKLVGISEFLDEITGYNDIIRATLGIDPKTFEKVSPTERGVSGALALPTSRLFKWVGMGAKWVFKGVKAEEILKAKKKLEKAIKELGKVEEKGAKKAEDVGKVEEKTSKSGIDAPKKSTEGKNKHLGKTNQSISNLKRDEAREVLQNSLKNGELSLNDLNSYIPKGTKNTFKSSERIVDGKKYSFELKDGQKATIRWHSPDKKAKELYPDSSSGTRWTAQIKIGNKSLGADGKWYKNQSLNIVHIPIKGR
ncbi:pre-toxin TG domain-containing protein, partial [Bacillus sp. CLL-7-23]